MKFKRNNLQTPPKKPSTPYAISRLAMDYHFEAIMKMKTFQ